MHLILVEPQGRVEGGASIDAERIFADIWPRLRPDQAGINREWSTEPPPAKRLVEPVLHPSSIMAFAYPLFKKAKLGAMQLSMRHPPLSTWSNFSHPRGQASILLAHPRDPSI